NGTVYPSLENGPVELSQSHEMSDMEMSTGQADRPQIPRFRQDITQQSPAERERAMEREREILRESVRGGPVTLKWESSPQVPPVPVSSMGAAPSAGLVPQPPQVEMPREREREREREWSQGGADEGTTINYQDPLVAPPAKRSPAVQGQSGMERGMERGRERHADVERDLVVKHEQRHANPPRRVA
ncbi:hypothetical protein KIPB_012282, partial [Kipferlia bialata]